MHIDKFGWVINAGKFCSRLKSWSLALLFSSSSGDPFSTTMLWGGTINKDRWELLVLEEIILPSKDICLEEDETAVGRYQQQNHEDLVLATPNSSESKTNLFCGEQPSSASTSWGDDKVVRIKRIYFIQAEGIPSVIPVQPCAIENQVTSGITLVHILFVFAEKTELTHKCLNTQTQNALFNEVCICRSSESPRSWWSSLLLSRIQT